MKTRITRKELKNSYGVLIPISYCSMQFLLQFKNPKYYLAGIYGWSADVYEIDNNTAIVTGYSPIGNVKVNYDIVKTAENKAEKQVKKYFMKSFNIKKAYREKLLNNLIKKILSGEVK